MNLNIDGIEIAWAVAGIAVGAVLLILSGGWALLGAFKADLRSQLNDISEGLRDRQNAWKEMLEAHIAAESAEFHSLHELRVEMAHIRRDLEIGYPTRAEMDDRLTKMQKSIDMIRAVVDRRSKAGEDPVSGRPVEGERRASREAG